MVGPVPLQARGDCLHCDTMADLDWLTGMSGAHRFTLAVAQSHLPSPPFTMRVQRDVSGIRRFLSWRRRPTKARLQPPAEVESNQPAEEESKEEKAKKVGSCRRRWVSASEGGIFATEESLQL